MGFGSFVDALKEEFDNFDNEKFDKVEEILADELTQYVADEKRQYWFDENVRDGSVSGKVLLWMKKNDPKAFALVMTNPEEVRGHHAVDNALEQLGLIKPWGEVDPHDTYLDSVNYDLYQQYRYETEY